MTLSLGSYVLGGFVNGCGALNDFVIDGCIVSVDARCYDPNFHVLFLVASFVVSSSVSS